MEHESRKKLRTAADRPPLSIDAFRNHTFVTNQNASKYANAWANLEEIYGRLQVLESRNEIILSENISLNQKYNSSSRLPSYAKIYGLSPSVIRFEVDTNSEAIALINKHATIFADKSKMVPATFHDSFQKFIETFKEEN
ncbi:hypothetical protein DTO027B5_4065 [Paecilomyces variotii]|nr:hypothetical protein DTO027B3_5663 [Paecilomyces variotii]KAJ9334157.1 hypothetical protein DTO027B5_4065 [Paecilomyces variotii]